jgi:hypothetical protein
VQQPDDDLGDDAERPLGADGEACEVVAGRIRRPAAQPDDTAFRRDDFEAEDVVGGGAVAEAVGAAGVLRHVATDGAGLLAGRVGRVVEAVPGDGGADVQVDDSRLHHGDPVLRVDLQDAVHTGGDDDDAAVAGDGAAGEAGAGPARRDRRLISAGDSHHFRDLLRAVRKDHGLRQAALYCRVVLVDYEVLGGVQDPFSAHGPLELPNELEVRHDIRV